MSLSSTNESVLQAIVEILLPSKHRIPELCLVMDGKKQRGSKRYGYLDIFVLGGIRGNNISIELKYISLIGLLRNTDGKLTKEFGANELEELDKRLEKEDEESLLDRQYVYYLKEFKQWKKTTIREILKDGANQLKSYMDTIAKGWAVGSASGVIDERIRVTRSNPNKLKGFIIIVVGFRRILCKSIKEISSDYRYNRV